MSQFNHAIGFGGLRTAFFVTAALSLTACNEGDPAPGQQTGSAINSPPMIASTPSRSATAGSPYSYVPNASDPDGDALEFSVDNKPSWAQFDDTTGRLSGTPAESDIGEHSGITISAFDGSVESMVGPFTIEVASAAAPSSPPPGNSRPTISGTPALSVVAGDAYRFTPAAGDADGDVLAFSIRGRPAWASFDPISGRLSGEPGELDTGTYSGIEISVSDGIASAALTPFTITVTSADSSPAPTPNSAPSISGTPAASIVAGRPYAFVPAATDRDGDTLSFAISGKPAWASFSTSTGALNGTPPESAVGVSTSMRISVSDGEATAALPAFSIEVLPPPNSPPVIAGQPPTAVTAGTAYSFTPQANDPDGDPLTFSIGNKPGWASFSTTTGRLSGMPTEADVRTYDGVVIRVSDGQATASLSAFGITVEQVSLGSVTLSWTPPTQNTDGSPLQDLAGYRIAYGTSSSALDELLELPNPGLTTAVIENLAAGIWFFAVRAVNGEQVESDLSQIVSKAVQ